MCALCLFWNKLLPLLWWGSKFLFGKINQLNETFCDGLYQVIFLYFGDFIVLVCGVKTDRTKSLRVKRCVSRLNKMKDALVCEEVFNCCLQVQTLHSGSLRILISFSVMNLNTSLSSLTDKAPLSLPKESSHNCFDQGTFLTAR